MAFIISHLNMQHSKKGATFLNSFCKEHQGETLIVSLNEPPINKAGEIKDWEMFKLHYLKDPNVRACIGIRGEAEAMFFNRLSSRSRVIAQIKIINGIGFYLV